MNPAVAGRAPALSSLWRYALPAAYALLVALHLAAGAGLFHPTVLSDEMIYLGDARALAGAGALPNQLGMGFDAPGYALFIWPAFLVTSDFLRAYAFVLAINALLMSTTVLSLYYLMRRIVGAERGSALAVATAVSCYPAYLLFSGVALSENALIPAFLATVVVLHRLVSAPDSRLWPAAFGAALALLYAIHFRGLAIIVAGVMVLAALAVLKRVRLVPAVLGLAVLVALVVATQSVERSMYISGWHADTNITSSFASGQLRYILQPSNWPALAVSLLGELYYLSVSTFGVAVFGFAYGVIALAKAARRRAWDAAAWTLAFALLSFAAIAFVAAVFDAIAVPYFSDDPTHPRFDFVVNGRYSETAIAVVLALAAWPFVTLRRVTGEAAVKRDIVVCAAVSVAVAALSIAVVVPRFLAYDFSGWPAVHSNVLVFYALARAFGTSSIAAVTAGAAAIATVIVLLALRSRGAALGALALAFCVLTAAEHQRDFVAVENNEATEHQVTRLYALRAQLADVPTVAYDMTTFNPYYYSSYALLDQRTAYVQFRSPADPPPAPVVIAAHAWNSAGAYREIACERTDTQCLWLSRSDPRTRNAKLMLALDEASPPSLVGTNFGGIALPTVQARGVYDQEQDAAGPFRWTNGAAEFHLPATKGAQPGVLHVRLGVLMPAKLDIALNGRTLLRSSVAAGVVDRRLALSHGDFSRPATIAIRSTPFRPAPVNGYTRQLGVQVRDLTLESAASRVRGILGAEFGSAALGGVVERGMYGAEAEAGQVFRWSNGDAVFRLPAQIKPKPSAVSFKIKLFTPQVVTLLVNGKHVYRKALPAGTTAASAPLHGLDVARPLTVELQSSTFRPEPVNGFTRTLGVEVLSMMLTTQ